MKPDSRFQGQPKDFWACVRTISQHVGYTQRNEGQIKVPSLLEMASAFRDLKLNVEHLHNSHGEPTALGSSLTDYFSYRANILRTFVEPNLMDVKEAKTFFEKYCKRLKPKCPLPMNKQKKEKRSPAYLTALVNMLIEKEANGLPCNYDPRELTTVTKDGVPLRTFARRVDGAFPSAINPIAMWEIKEYYYTTTFGSRVADGVYETLLDGMEIEELREHENIDVKHYLIIDSHYTWWECGRSYLCRIIDILHMGYIDEVIFGKEVIKRLPELVQEWIKIAKVR